MRAKNNQKYQILLITREEKIQSLHDGNLLCKQHPAHIASLIFKPWTRFIACLDYQKCSSTIKHTHAHIGTLSLSHTCTHTYRCEITFVHLPFHIKSCVCKKHFFDRMQKCIRLLFMLKGYNTSVQNLCISYVLFKWEMPYNLCHISIQWCTLLSELKMNIHL